MTRARRAFCLLACLAGASLVGGATPIQFADVTHQSDLRKPLDGMMAHAAAWGDVDGDGDLDLYVGGFADRPDEAYLPAKGPVRNRLFRNLGGGRFEVVANAAVELLGRTSSAVFVDLDNDGWLDSFVANNARPASRLAPGARRDAQLRGSGLFRNSEGTLVDVTSGAADCLTAPGAARSVGVLDVDGDGLLDLLVLDDRFGPPPRSRLCRNEGAFRFTDVTGAVGLPRDIYGLGLAIADVNEDGRPDIFVSHSNRLFVSTGRSAYTEPPGPRAQLAWKPVDEEDWPAGAVFADLNRDGRLDSVLGIHHEQARNRVYLTDGFDAGSLVFHDVSRDVGLPARLLTKSPHVEVQDFDNDGWPDLYFSAAWLDADGAVTPLVFRHLGVRDGLPRFEANRSLSGEAPRVYFPTGPSADYDGDGRIDLFLGNWFRGNHSRLLRNVSFRNRWIEVSVVGRKTNRMGIGTKVRVYREGLLNQARALLGMQEIGTTYGFSSGQVAVAHFGLGREPRVDVSVEWPNRSRTSMKSVDTDARLTIEER